MYYFTPKEYNKFSIRESMTISLQNATHELRSNKEEVEETSLSLNIVIFLNQ